MLMLEYATSIHGLLESPLHNIPPTKHKGYRCNGAVGSRMVKEKVGGFLALYCPKLAKLSTVIYIVYTMCLKYI